MSDAPRDLADFHDRAWSVLTRAGAERDAPMRFLTLATSGADGWPEARMVVLRGTDRAAATLTTHSDALADKVAQLRADPRATLIGWSGQDSLQLRLRVRVEIATGADAMPVWDSLSAGARQAYGGAPPPGSAIDSPQDHTTDPDPARLAVLTAHVTQMEALHLARDIHHRAAFTRDEAWAGRWVAP